MATDAASKTTVSEQKVARILPFRYQFAAGAVAGISEVSESTIKDIGSSLTACG